MYPTRAVENIVRMSYYDSTHLAILIIYGSSSAVLIDMIDLSVSNDCLLEHATA